MWACRTRSLRPLKNSIPFPNSGLRRDLAGSGSHHPSVTTAATISPFSALQACLRSDQSPHPIRHDSPTVRWVCCDLQAGTADASA